MADRYPAVVVLGTFHALDEGGRVVGSQDRVRRGWEKRKRHVLVRIAAVDDHPPRAVVLDLLGGLTADLVPDIGARGGQWPAHWASHPAAHRAGAANVAMLVSTSLTPGQSGASPGLLSNWLTSEDGPGITLISVRTRHTGMGHKLRTRLAGPGELLYRPEGRLGTS
jgi:hypothetical protein